MVKNTNIQWTDHTWNPWRGCRKVCKCCANCYMFREQKRYGNDPTQIIRAADQTFKSPLKWKDPAFVLTCSWSDFFIREADAWRDQAWDIIRNTPHLTYQILTKRAARIRQCLPPDWGHGWNNVWLGASIGVNDSLTQLNFLLGVPARIRFISAEPLLESVDFGLRLWSEQNSPNSGKINWVIVGGESGPAARPMFKEWVQLIQEDCALARIPFFFKQWGGPEKINGSYGGHKLNGKMVREMPSVQMSLFS